MSFFLMQHVRSLLKVVIRSYRVGFGYFICHYTSIPYSFLTLGLLLDHGLWCLTIFCLVYIIVLPWIGPHFHEYPSLEHFVIFWYACPICHRSAEVFLAIFHNKLSLIIGLFYKLSLFIRLPTFMEFL